MDTDTETNMDIAKTIIEQIGNHAFFMVGAKNLVAHEDGLSFKIMRNSKGVTHIDIRLADNDTYTIEFVNFNMRRTKTDPRKVVSHFEGVYAEMLLERLEFDTDLAWRMPKIRRTS